jgi:hypothetical protein
MTTVTPYKRGHYPTIEGNDRVYFEEEFRKIEQTLRQVVSCLNTNYVAKTIASGAVVYPSGSHLVTILELDTESAAASDDLDTITGGVEGQILVLKSANDARTVVVKDSTGNLELEGDMSLDNVQDTITLYNKSGTEWREVARSNNGA